MLKSKHTPLDRGPRGRGKGKGKGKGEGNLYRPPALRRDDSSGGVCYTFGRTGSCPKGDRCAFLHVRVDTDKTDRVPQEGLGRHTEVIAHSAQITAIAMTEEGIYTVSQDKSLKRWKPERADANGPYQLKAELTVELGCACFCLLCNGGWLFCGLWDGSIKAFSKDGANTVLKGHTKRVTALLIHANVLISGGADREVRLWQFNESNKTFACSHTLKESMPGPISCMRVLGEHLFIGGLSGVAMCNLTSLAVTKLLPPMKSVSQFLEFMGCVIVAYAEGALRIFDAEGTMKSEMKTMAAGPIVSIGGLESGPMLLCGHAHGQVSTISLPGFEFRTQFQAIVNDSIESLFCPGDSGLFLLGSKHGALQLWQRIAG